MGINSAFSSWLRGAQSSVSSGIQAANALRGAIQQQTMTAISAAQRAVTQPFQQQTQSTSRRGPTPAPHTTRTATSVDLIGGAARTIRGGVRGAQQAAQQIVRAHAPIVQGVRRDASRAIRAAPAAIQSAPRSVQQAAQQISRAHAPIVQGLRRDASRAIRAAPAAIQSAPRSVQQAAQQISRTHAPIIQGVRRDASAAIRSVGGAGAPRQAAPRVAGTPSPAQQTRGPGGGVGGRSFAPQQAPGRTGTPAPASRTPIRQDLQRDVGVAAPRSVGGAGPMQHDIRYPAGASRSSTPKTFSGPSPFAAASRAASLTSPGPQTQNPSPAPGPTPGSSSTPAQAPLTPQQRQTKYAQDVERYHSNPGHTRIPQLLAQHKYAVEQYGIDPELRQYEQKLAAYNAQLAAHQNAVGRGRGRQETAERLQSMQQSLEWQRTSIMSRKNQELDGIRALEANIKMLGTPLQVEYQRLKAEERALLSAEAKAQQPPENEFFKPLFNWGQEASQWWTKNAAPAIEGAIDSLPYLGPATRPRFHPGPSGVGGRSGNEPTVSPGKTRGEITYVPASPLTGGGTRLRPNWEGDIGHDLAKGAAVDMPQHTIEFVTAAPLGVERAVRMGLRDPVGAVTLTGGGLVAVGEGMSTAAQENPGRFAGEMAGSMLLGRAAGAGYSRVAKPAAVTAGEATGLVRKQTYGFGGTANTNPVQYMSRAENLQTILENPRISGVRAASAPVGEFARDVGLIPTRKMQIRNPAAIGDVPAGQSVSAEGVFMSISRPGLIEPYGTWFTKGGTKRGGIKGKVLGSRVYLHENIRTVQIPKALKDRIYQRVRETGEFWGEDYDTVLKLAKKQSRQYGEPVAVPSPKRAIGILEPENEAFLVFADDVSRKITGTKFAGLSSEGTIVKRISVGQQPPISQTRLGSIGENLRYNWDLGREGSRIYNRRYLEAQAQDMVRKKGELYDGSLSYPGEYGGHGLDHALGVQRGLLDQWSASPTLQRLTTPSEQRLRAKYHDIAKIGDAETQPYPHGWAAGTAIRKGMIPDPELLSLPKKTQKAIGRDIQLHTDIQPTLRSQIWHRPSPTAKALATADRLDLTRFGVPVKSSKLFPVPEETFGFKVGQVADQLPIGFQVRFVDTPAPPSRGAAATARSSSGDARSLAPARPSTPAPAPAAPKGGEMLDYSYPNSGKPATKPTLIPPAKEYGYPSRSYEGSPYAAPYGTQYLEPAPTYQAPYSEPYAAPPHSPPYPEPYVAPPYTPPYPEPYVAPPYGGPYSPPYPEPYGTPYAPPYPETYPPTPARPRSPLYTPYSKPPAGAPAGAPAPRPPQDNTRKTAKRRRRRPGELDHWELGPAPGLEEMHGLIFGSPGRSGLDFGTSILDLSAAPRAPLSLGPSSVTVMGLASLKRPAHAARPITKGILNDAPRTNLSSGEKTSHARTTKRSRRTTK